MNDESGTPLLSGTIATCSCAEKKHFEVWPALTIWRRKGIGSRWWNKCRFTFGWTSILWLLLHLLEMDFIWTGVWQGSLLWMGRVDLFLLFKEDFLAFIRSTLALIRRTLALTRTTFSSMSAPDIVSAAHYVWQAYRQPRDGWRLQNRWIFGKVPNGLWSPPPTFICCKHPEWKCSEQYFSLTSIAIVAICSLH